MKKSKVLIPAMALLLFSTAASITGTVAWFTSTRTFTMSAGDFEVAKLDGDLSCALEGVVATKVTGDAPNQSISVAPANGSNTYLLGDASFDHLQKKLFTDTDVEGTYEPLDTMTAASPATNGFNVGNTANYQYSTIGTKTYFYAAVWKMTFSYQFVAESANINVFFNINSSSATPVAATGGIIDEDSGNETAQGFRIAFLSNTAAKVWAPLCDKTAGSYNAGTKTWTKDVSYTPTFVTSTSAADGAYSGDFIDSTTTLAKATDTTASQTSRLDYLATITNPGNATIASVTVTCVAWYEGTDPNVVDDTYMQKVSASMSFYACLNN